MTDGSVSDVSQAYTSAQSVEYQGMPVAYTHQDIGVRHQITRLHNRLKGDVSSLILRVALGKRTAKYMRAYTSGKRVSSPVPI